MSSYDDRKKGFESKFAHDKEMAFKIAARRNKLLGLWAAAKLGKEGDAAEQYAKEVVMADFEEVGHDDVVRKLVEDFNAANVSVSEKEILVETERLNPIAEQQVMDEVKQA